MKQRVVEDEVGRKAAYARFLESQQHAQFDPWEMQAADAPTAAEFTPLKVAGSPA